MINSSDSTVSYWPNATYTYCEPSSLNEAGKETPSLIRLCPNKRSDSLNSPKKVPPKLLQGDLGALQRKSGSWHVFKIVRCKAVLHENITLKHYWFLCSRLMDACYFLLMSPLNSVSSWKSIKGEFVLKKCLYMKLLRTTMISGTVSNTSRSV